MLKLLCALYLLLSAGCSKNHKDELRVAATCVPHAVMLQEAKRELATEGIDLTVVVIDDYQAINRALADGEVEANFFQHEPFLERQMIEFGYPLQSAGKIHIEPMGAYSKKPLQDGGTIAIPSDPSNQLRALKLLEQSGLIVLKPNAKQIVDIQSNPHHFHFQDVDAALLARSLDDVDLAVIPTNFALQAGLHPTEDALFLEDTNSPYANILVVLKGHTKDPRIQKLIQALRSEKMRAFLRENYGGAILLCTNAAS